MVKKTVLLLLVFAFHIACKQDQSTNITLNQENSAPVFVILDKQMKVPLKIGGDSQAIFFETENGKNWLSGKANELKETENGLEARWSFDDREVQVRIEQDSGQYHFSFSANPDSDILKWGIQLSATPDEYFTGLFERTVDGTQEESWKEGISQTLNLRGQEVEMMIKPTLSLYNPFYLSSNGYGLFIEGTWPGHYDMAKSDPEKVSVKFEGPSMSGIIYVSDQPAEIIKAHSLHTGPTILPPKWAFSHWRWRDNHDHLEEYYDGTPVTAPYNSQLVEDLLMMDAYDIPYGAYWVDRPWAKGFMSYEDFEWDPERFPNAIKMIDWIHSKDAKFLLWAAPWVAGNMKTEADQKGYNVPLKGPHNAMDSSNVSLVDFTNPKAVDWWQKNGIEKMLNQGVDGFKLDRAEEMVPESRNIHYDDGRTAREVRNDYPVMYAKAAYESGKEIKGDDFVLIARAGYTGSSQYTTFWGGDIGSPPEGLRAAIIAMQRSAILGYPIWGSDIGGYWQGDLDREVFARWLAFGAFNPIMEVGPTEDRAPWDMDLEPHYDQELIAIWRLYAKLHTDLIDYSYASAKEAQSTGMPIVRPLFLHYPDQKEAWEDWQTFLYGPDILVSTIWEKGKSSHKLYLPAGDKWRDAWDKDQVYEGGQWIEIETPLYKIPIFVKDSADLQLDDLQSVFEESLKLAEERPDLKALEQKAFSPDNN